MWAQTATPEHSADVRLLLMEQLRHDTTKMRGLQSQLCRLPRHLKHTASRSLSVCALETEVVVTVDGSDVEGRGGSLLELVSTQHLAYHRAFAILSIEHWD